VERQEHALAEEQVQDSEQLIERVAALDIGKATLVCCTRVPGEQGRRVQTVTEHATMTRSLGLLADRLLELGVTRVVMEATSDYWKPPFYVLEAHGLQVWLVNAKDVKHLPGRPKTDLLTELPGPFVRWIERWLVDVSRLPLRDQQRRRASRSVPSGAVAGRCVGGNWGPVPALPAG